MGNTTSFCGYKKLKSNHILLQGENDIVIKSNQFRKKHPELAIYGNVDYVISSSEEDEEKVALKTSPKLKIKTPQSVPISRSNQNFKAKTISKLEKCTRKIEKDVVDSVAIAGSSQPALDMMYKGRVMPENSQNLRNASKNEKIMSHEAIPTIQLIKTNTH